MKTKLKVFTITVKKKKKKQMEKKNIISITAELSDFFFKFHWFWCICHAVFCNSDDCSTDDENLAFAV